jgi:lipopolysaccharide export system permease protein
MRLLDRYLLRELLVPLGYCLGGFLVFWVFFDLLSELDEFQQRGLLPVDVAQYYLVKLPELLVTITPVGLLLALLYALTHHARHQELTAMRAAGVSLWRLAAPYLLVGWTFSVGLFALNEFVAPDGNEAAQLILGRRQADGAAAADRQWRRNLAFYNERDRRVWNIGAYHLNSGQMLAPNLEWVQPDGSRRRLFAERALYTNRVWVFYGAKQLLYLAQTNFLPLRSETNELALAELTETPAQIKSEIKFSELNNYRAAKRPRLSLKEILDYRRLHPHLNRRNQFKLETQFHGRLAEPWQCLVAVLIAIPFGAPSGRRNVLVGVASSIFIGFAYFVLLRVGLASGTGGYLPPWLAAWLPNAVFAAAGVFLTMRVR